MKYKNILYIDTTEPEGLAALYKNNKLTKRFFDKKHHSEILLENIYALLQENNLKLEDISAFCANKGPGRFTGTRIGVLTASVFAFIMKKDYIPLKNDDKIENIAEIIKKRQPETKLQALYNRSSYFE
ncbi:MAG: tRNA (adenosine(37)-N6)-threonylcarbamoyltransferase complex dimerization subunit type 1 TsaB [Candidatus Muiribacteriota bacterium]